MRNDRHSASRPSRAVGGAMGVLVLCAGLAATAAGQSASNRLEQLSSDLERTRSDIEQARQAADEANKRYFRFNHDVVYTNAAAKAIYEEIVALEKQVVDKRRALNDMLMTTAEMKAVRDERRRAYERLTALTDRERSLLNDIKAERWKSAGAVAPAEGGGDEL